MNYWDLECLLNNLRTRPDLELDEIKERLEALESIQAENLESIMVYNPDFEDQDEYEEETGSL